MCLSHSLVHALREVGSELGAARLLALQRRDHDRLCHIEHVPELDRANHVLVEDPTAVVDHRFRRLFLEPANDLVRLREPVLIAEHGDVLVHGLAELVLDRGDATAARLAIDDRGDVALGVSHL